MNRFKSILTNQTGRVLRRLSALLLVCGLCVPFLMCSGSAASSAVEVLADSTVSFCEWKHVYSRNDLPEGTVDMMIIFMDNDTRDYYMLDGNSLLYKDKSKGLFGLLGITPPKGVIVRARSFVTPWGISHMHMTYKDTDKQNQNSKRYFIYCDGIPTDSKQLEVYRKDTSKNLFSTSTGNGDPSIPFTIRTNDDYFRGMMNDMYVSIFTNIPSGIDTPWNYTGNFMYPKKDRTESMEVFEMYVAHEKKYSAVTHDITVQSGQVQNVDGDVYICPGVTITVEPGAVLSIQGNVYNNGYIYNQGDVLLQKGACIQPFFLEEDGGAICCDGGDLILLSGARMITGKCSLSDQYGNGFLLKNGATCTNYGTIILPTNGRLESGAALDNRKSGSLLQGYQLPDSLEGNLHTASQSRLTYSNLKSTFTCKYNKSSDNYELSGTATSLYLGYDTLLQNQGTIVMNGLLRAENGAEQRNEGEMMDSPELETYRKYLSWEP